LDDFETILNVNGNQRIFKLQSSILQHGAPNGRGANEPHSRTMNGHQRGLHGQGSDHERQEDTIEASISTTFDMDFTPDGLEALPPRRVHYFGQVEVVRDTVTDHESSSQDEHEDDRKRQRIAGEPNYEKYVVSTLSISFGILLMTSWEQFITSSVFLSCAVSQ